MGGDGRRRTEPLRSCFAYLRGLAPDSGDPESLGDASVFALLEEAVGWSLDRNQRGPRSDGPGHRQLSARSGTSRGSPKPQPSHRDVAGVSGLEEGSGSGRSAEGSTSWTPRPVRSTGFGHNVGGGAGLPANRVLSLLADRAGALWVGTWGGGLFRVSGSSLYLASGTDEVPEPPDLLDRDVTGLWPGIEPAGSGSGCATAPCCARTPGRDRTAATRSDGSGSILRILPAAGWQGVGGNDQGPPAPDPGTRPRSSGSVTIPSDPASLGPGFVTALLEDRQGRLWVGTGEGGLQELDRDGRVLRRFLHQPRRSGEPERRLCNRHSPGSPRARFGWGPDRAALNTLDPRTGRAAALPAPIRRTRARSATTTSRPFWRTHRDACGSRPAAEGSTAWSAPVPTAVPLHPLHDRRRTGRQQRHGHPRGRRRQPLAEHQARPVALRARSVARSRTTSRPTVCPPPSSRSGPRGAHRAQPALRVREAGWSRSRRARRSRRRPRRPPWSRPCGARSEELRGDRPSWARERLDIPYGTWFSIEVAVLDFNTEHNHAHAYRLGREKTAGSISARAG